MIKYLIVMEATIVQKLEIEANDTDEAIDKAKEYYENGALAISQDKIQFKQMAIFEPANEMTDWMEF